MSIREQRILETEIGLQRIRWMKRAFWILLGLATITACVTKIPYNPYP